MCGIAGIISPNATKYNAEIQQMTDAIAYRGPDSAHHELFENAALGHRRLSIIDLSETGKQPMLSNTGNECIVLNGEIYGYIEIKELYSDYPYRGSSDTEIILAMYQKKEERLIYELPGMFAFAIWDERKQQLFCARDRFGEKPFYYAIGNNNEFIFASEIKSIIASGLIQPEIDQQQIAYYLKNGYIHPHKTIYRNIFNLKPAHTLTLKEGKISVKPYWKIPTQNSLLSLDDSIEKFKYLLDNAIKKQLVADVPVGSFLSGGLDSSTIVAVASQYKKKIRTLVYGYENGDLNEMPYAKAIADKYQTDHHILFDKKQKISQTLCEVYSYMDEPLMDSSLLPTHLIFKEASKNLKVVLSGDVGDELFGGYTFYKYNIDLSQKGYYSNYLSKMFLFANKFKNIGSERQHRAQYNDIIDFHQNKVRNYFSYSEIKELGIDEQIPEQDFSFQPSKIDFNDLMRIDLEKYVPGNMLLKGDRTSMYNSVEVRIPFLDIDFAEFCIQLPWQYKVNKNEDKIILRKAYASAWTEEIINRGKNGFAASVTEWFKEKELQELSNSLLKNPESYIFKYLHFTEVQKKLNFTLQHWSIVILAIWFENNKKHLL
ncbi:asparagine synthase (glutamine-hydrolyzing) [Chryseobacterium taihuense]|uniref:asparagine synthase (glutamine-hydrolyzing) n=1 Tax=Chryseobacterium taihuense TaxID=1141221 RepID=A0ABY0QTM8_9FLAO|nr:asparagine synthase (glutamine-hydrolyzing) [Chryseobacterium taihuense]SDL86117.1 asparagine synthase (glutamine-hydrolysing) [Chryseobacterium taihuense]